MRNISRLEAKTSAYVNSVPLPVINLKNHNLAIQQRSYISPILPPGFGEKEVVGKGTNNLRMYVSLILNIEIQGNYGIQFTAYELLTKLLIIEHLIIYIYILIMTVEPVNHIAGQLNNVYGIQAAYIKLGHFDHIPHNHVNGNAETLIYMLQLCIKLQAFRRQINAPASAPEKLYTKGILHLHYPAAYSRLTDIKLFGSLCIVQMFCYSEENFYLLDRKTSEALSFSFYPIKYHPRHKS